MKKTFALTIVVLSAALIVFGLAFGIAKGTWALPFSASIWAILSLVAGIALLVVSIVMIVKSAKEKWGGLALATGICGVAGFFVPLVGFASLIMAIIILVKK